jgi:hypothetical protein
MNTIFGSVPLPVSLWKWLLLGGIAFFVVVELEKLLVRQVFARVAPARA